MEEILGEYQNAGDMKWKTKYWGEDSTWKKEEQSL